VVPTSSGASRNSTTAPLAGIVERIIARIEAGPEGVDTRFIATNLDAGWPRTIYETVYCQRGQAENHIKSFKTHLAADRTSCHTSSTNQLRLFLHAGAYWMMWEPLRADAATLVVARHAVRYPAPATGQTRRSRGGPEAADQAAPADQHTGSGNLHKNAMKPENKMTLQPLR
jgi:hypothetical protein